MKENLEKMYFGFKVNNVRYDFVLDYYQFDDVCILKFPRRTELGNFDFNNMKPRKVTSITTAAYLINNDAKAITECYCSHTDIDTKENGYKEALTRLFESARLNTPEHKEFRSLVWRVFHEAIISEQSMWNAIHESGRWGQPVINAPRFEIS